MELLTLFIVAFVFYYIGWFMRGIHVIKLLARDPERIIKMLEEIKKINAEEEHESSTNLEGTELAIERHGNMLYAFAKENDQFIAQGTDLNVLLEEAKKRFPDRKFFGVIDKDNPAKELA